MLSEVKGKWFSSLLLSWFVLSLVVGSGCAKETRVITVISREEGSGTRTSFDEMVMEGDLITKRAILLPSNGAVRNAVAGTPAAIGYLSLGYVDSSVKALPIDGVECTVENCRSGDYPIVRSLYFLTKEQPQGLVKEFIDFCLSEEGQGIVEGEGYVSLGRTKWQPALPRGTTGKITEAGSTTVQPLAEKLATAFKSYYPNVEIIIQGGGSSVGVKSCQDGTVDIGAASRDLKPEEPKLKTYPIAGDAIAIIVHPSNSVSRLTKEQVRQIFCGEIDSWSQIG